jgi:hypothetical protein
MNIETSLACTKIYQLRGVGYTEAGVKDKTVKFLMSQGFSKKHSIATYDVAKSLM